MVKNYATSSDEEITKKNDLKPNKETVSFLLSYSKSFSIQQSKTIKNVRLDKN